MSDNFTDFEFNNTTPPVAAAVAPDYNFPALIFGILLIIVIIGGNVLVCLSVYMEKALKTTTNYFIVSLAVADLLLAVLVLPLFVFAEFQGGVWSLNNDAVCCVQFQGGVWSLNMMLCVVFSSRVVCGP
ncbi:D(4) dopamine receptor-like isoform X2 [Oncorhynchus keta]|uniref:D(4) dopamine receptor-like isoform X2 n=1 Tax=Oncorhynchus keta TaxID=8018 RepID=UPI00227B4DEE|nr:D(4) dopamine receptor-like isoform X2 [Oncorhynchus keta]